VCSCDSVNSRAPNGPSNWSSHRLFLVNINSNNLAAMKTLVVKPYFFRRRQRSLPINSPSISAATKPSGFVTLTHRHRPSRDSTARLFDQRVPLVAGHSTNFHVVRIRSLVLLSSGFCSSLKNLPLTTSLSPSLRPCLLLRSLETRRR